jgi:hypothetical protein
MMDIYRVGLCQTRCRLSNASILHMYHSVTGGNAGTLQISKTCSLTTIRGEHVCKMWLNAVWRIKLPMRLDYPDASHVCKCFVS